MKKTYENLWFKKAKNDKNSLKKRYFKILNNDEKNKIQIIEKAILKLNKRKQLKSNQIEI